MAKAMANSPPRATPTKPMPVASPQVCWTLRETISGPGAIPAILSWASSKAMAWPTWGSPKIQAKTRARAAAASPVSMPRTSKLRIMMVCCSRPSVAREAEQVPAIVHELVHVVPADQGGGALLGADEVEEQQAQHGGEDRPRHDLPHRDADRDRLGAGGRRGEVRHGYGLLRENARPVRWSP